MTEVDRFIDENWEEIVEEIARLVSVPSVADFDRATPEDPSGPRRMTVCVLRLTWRSDSALTPETTPAR